MNLFPFWLPTPVGNPTFVLAPEVTSAWGIPGSRNNYASDVLSIILRSIAIVPENWVLDVAEQLRLGVRAGKLTESAATRFLTGLWALPIWVDNETPLRAVGDTFALARARRLTINSAAYLELALRLHLPLATADATLLRAATATGVPLFTP